MTTIAAVMRRSYTPSIFEDLTTIPHTRVPRDPVTNLTTFVFDGDLDATTVEAIWARVESRDDADQGKRANLRALRAAVVADPSLENVAALAMANNDYLLGDQ